MRVHVPELNRKTGVPAVVDVVRPPSVTAEPEVRIRTAMGVTIWLTPAESLSLSAHLRTAWRSTLPQRSADL